MTHKRLLFLVCLLLLSLLLPAAWAAPGGSVADGRPAEATHTLFAPVVAAPAVVGEWIAYHAEVVDFRWDIFVIRPDGTGRRNLTHSAEMELSPAWSPDGTRLAFSQTRTDNQATLVTTDASGHDRRVITADPDLEFIGGPTWSPDGARLAFTAMTNDDGWDIYVINVDGSGLTNVTPNLEYQNEAPAWSPDGTKIVFANITRDHGALWQLAVVSPEGGPVTFLTNDPERAHSAPDWSPDGQRILFTTWEDGQSWLYTLPAAGGPATPLLASAADGRWSPDGASIVFIGGGGGLFRASAYGTGITTIDATPDLGGPDWRP